MYIIKSIFFFQFWCHICNILFCAHLFPTVCKILSSFLRWTSNCWRLVKVQLAFEYAFEMLLKRKIFNSRRKQTWFYISLKNIWLVKFFQMLNSPKLLQIYFNPVYTTALNVNFRLNECNIYNRLISQKQP